MRISQLLPSVFLLCSFHLSIHAAELGIRIQDLPPGVRVASVVPNSPAATRVSLGQPYAGYPAGTLISMEPGDLIVEINGAPIRSETEFANAVDGSGPNMLLKVVNLQDGNSYGGSVQLGTQPRFGVTTANFPLGVRIVQNTHNFTFTLTQTYRGYPAGTSIRLEAGDVVTQVNGVPVRTVVELQQQLMPLTSVVTIAVTNLRDGNSYSATLNAGQTPVPPIPPFPPGPPVPPNQNLFPPAPTAEADVAHLLTPRMTFVWCRAGSFTMGDPNTAGPSPVLPQLNVNLTRDFWLKDTEVTQGEYTAIMGTTPWTGQNSVRVDFSDYPATYVDWDEAMQFCAKLTQQERAAGRLRPGWEFTLPTEAQWEYACRDGIPVPQDYCDQVTLANLSQHSWHNGNSANNPQRVRTRQFSPRWRLCDTMGNVCEWCRDGFVHESLRKGGIDPFEQSFMPDKVTKGGSIIDAPASCRSAIRNSENKARRSFFCGFRVALVQIP